MSFFVAKFNQVSNGSETFSPDKNGVMPFIGTILAGVATGSIANGTVFLRENKKPDALYLCENYTDEEYPENVQVRIISEMTTMELLTARKELGEGRLHRVASTSNNTPVVAPIDESEVIASETQPVAEASEAEVVGA